MVVDWFSLSQEELIEKSLAVVTDCFSSDDIFFISQIEYPQTVTLVSEKENEIYDEEVNEEFDEDTDENVDVYSFVVPDLDTLMERIRRIDRECTIVIPSALGKMIITTRRMG